MQYRKDITFFNIKDTTFDNLISNFIDLKIFTPLAHIHTRHYIKVKVKEGKEKIRVLFATCIRC